MNTAENIPLSGLPSVSKYLNESGLYTHKVYAEAKCCKDANATLTDRREQPEDGDTDKYVAEEKVHTHSNRNYMD